MQIVYFGGYSTKNIEEGENICSALRNSGYNVYFNRWRHWTDESMIPSVEIPGDIQTLLAKFSNKDEIGIIGKSLGTYAAVHLAKELTSKVKTLILMGIPINDISESEKEEYFDILKNIPNITVIQNRNDDHGSAEQIQEMLKDLNYKFIIKESDNHRYNYPDDIISILGLI